MIRRFFIDKTNTIIENSYQNMGLNPILRLAYGTNIMRGIIYFDIKQIKELIDDKTFANIDKLKFYLSMTNCFSVDGVPYEKIIIDNNEKYGERASSFDLMLFKLPCNFDMGRGYDYISDFWVKGNKSFKTEGSNWFYSKTNVPWIEYGKEYIKKEDNGGIYSFERLNKEYENYKNGEESIIVGTQHFDFGNENLYIDITKYVLESIKDNNNYGLCLSFTPDYEKLLTETTQCVDFFTNNTNTFFHPIIEAIYDEYIIDRRENYYKNGDNNLYLYSYDDYLPCNLDNIPSCFIDDIEIPVKQVTKGVYKAEISNENIKLIDDTIYYDRWSKIALNGEKMDDIELEFYVNKNCNKIMIGTNSLIKKDVKPTISGINDGQDLNVNDICSVKVYFREKYTTDKYDIIKSAKYRLYVKDGEREIDIIKYHPIEMAFNNNFFTIYATDLIPNKYYVDILIESGKDKTTFKNVLRFNVVNNITNYYE